MVITYHYGIIIADFKQFNVSGEPGVGCYRIKFRMNYTTRVWPGKQYEFWNAKAEVYVNRPLKNDFLFLGYAEPEEPIWIKTLSKSINSFTVFNLILNSYQVNLLEGIRNGKDLQFKLKIYGEIDGDEGSGTTRDEIIFYVNQSQWLDILKQIKYGEYLLFEVPLPVEKEYENLKSVVDLLNQAKNHFLYGNYDDTVASCRKALESLAHQLNEKRKQAEAKRQFKEKEQTLSKQQRILLIREVLRHLTHLAHHVSDTGEVVPFSRNEANFVMGSTAAIISLSLQKIVVK